MNITITDKAVKEIKKVIEEQEVKDEKTYFRIRVVGGGCSGFAHKLDLDQEFKEGKDTAYEIDGIDVVVDNRSALYLDGVTIDFYNDLNKRGFSVFNPSARSVCGCGSSFAL